MHLCLIFLLAALLPHTHGRRPFPSPSASPLSSSPESCTASPLNLNFYLNNATELSDVFLDECSSHTASFLGHLSHVLCHGASIGRRLVLFIVHWEVSASAEHTLEMLRPVSTVLAWSLHSYIRVVLALRGVEYAVLCLLSLPLLAATALHGGAALVQWGPAWLARFTTPSATPLSPRLSACILLCGLLVSFLLEEKRQGPLTQHWQQRVLALPPTLIALGIVAALPAVGALAALLQQQQQQQEPSRLFHCRPCILTHPQDRAAAAARQQQQQQLLAPQPSPPSAHPPVTLAQACTRSLATLGMAFLFLLFWHLWSMHAALGDLANLNEVDAAWAAALPRGSAATSFSAFSEQCRPLIEFTKSFRIVEVWGTQFLSLLELLVSQATWDLGMVLEKVLGKGVWGALLAWRFNYYRTVLPLLELGSAAGEACCPPRGDLAAVEAVLSSASGSGRGGRGGAAGSSASGSGGGEAPQGAAKTKGE